MTTPTSPTAEKCPSRCGTYVCVKPIGHDGEHASKTVTRPAGNSSRVSWSNGGLNEHWERVAPAACPATGRSAGACIDQSHAACSVGSSESAALDRKLESERRASDPTY